MTDILADDNTDATVVDKNDSVDSTVVTQDPPKKEEGAEEPKVDDVKATEEGDPAKPKEEEKEEAGEKKDAELKLTLPDGSLLDAKALDAVSDFAKENGIDQKGAQALLDRESANHKAFVEGQQERLAQQSNEWVEAVKKDAEIGGENFSKNAELAKRVIDRFGNTEFKEALNETRLGNHPELVRMLVRIGKAMSEDQLVRGHGGPTVKKDAASVLYGDTSKKE